MKELQWWNIAVIHADMPHFTLAVESLARYLDQENQKGNNPIASIVSVTGLHGFLDRRTPPEVTTRIFVALVPEDEAALLLCGAFHLNLVEENYQFIFIGVEQSPSMMLKKGVEINTFHRYPQCSLNELEIASEAALFITHDQLVSSPEVQPTFTEKQSKFWGKIQKKLNGEMATGVLAQFSSRIMATYDAVWAISLALQKVLNESNSQSKNLKFTNTTNTGKYQTIGHNKSKISNAVLALNAAMEQTDFDGLSSRIQFNSTSHSLQNPTAYILQMQAGVVVPIGQHEAANDTTDLGYYGNELKWRGSVFPQDRPTIILKVASIYIVCVMLSISFLGIVLVMTMLGINWSYRKHKVIKASSPYLNFVIISGCLFGFLFVPLLAVENLDLNYWIPSEAYYVLCNVRPLLLSTGFTLSFGALFAKTFRIYLVFRDPWTKKRAAKDSKLFAIIGMLLVYDIVVIVLWVSISPLTIVRSILNFNPEEFTEELYCNCAPRGSSSSGATSVNFLAWIALITLPKAIILTLGILLVIQTSKIKAEFFRDAKYTGIAIFGVLIACGIGVPTALFTMLFRLTNITYILANVTVLTCSYLILVMVFAPKFYLLHKYRKNVPARVLIGLNPSFRVTRNLPRGNGGSALELYGRAIRNQQRFRNTRRHPLVHSGQVHGNTSVTFKRAYTTICVPNTAPEPICVPSQRVSMRNRPPIKKPAIQVESLEDWWEPAFEENTPETVCVEVHETPVSFEGYQGIVSVLDKGELGCANQSRARKNQPVGETTSSVGSLHSTITEVELLEEMEGDDAISPRVPYFHFSSFNAERESEDSAGAHSLTRSKSCSFSRNI